MHRACQTNTAVKDQENRQPEPYQMVAGSRPLFQKDPFGKLFRRRPVTQTKEKSQQMDEIRRALLYRRAQREQSAREQMAQLAKYGFIVPVASATPFQLMQPPLPPPDDPVVVITPVPQQAPPFPLVATSRFKVKEPLPLSPWAYHSHWRKAGSLVDCPNDVDSRIKVMEAIEALASMSNSHASA